MSGVVIWKEEMQDIARGASPAMLWDIADAWAADLKRFGPWSPSSTRWNNVTVRGWSSPVDVLHSCLIVGPCTSCLDFSWQLAERGTISHWDSALAISQSAGRGQLGRNWHSPPGNIYGAWVIPAPKEPFRNRLSLLVGYVVIRALSEVGAVARLKWPNDIIIGHRKVGGILVEERNGKIIAGIGINLTSSPETDFLGERRAIPPGYLRDLGYDFTPLNLWLHLVKRGKTYFNDIVAGSSSQPLFSTLTGSLAYLGESVLVEDGHGETFRGRVMGLADDGQLKLAVKSSVRTIRSGSIYPI